MAYGITGAGKTFTMLGDQSQGFKSSSLPGISVLAIDSVFKLIEGLKEGGLKDYTNIVKLSYLEVYNENIKDLLSPHKPGSMQLVIIEDPNKGIHVPGLKEVEVTNA